MKITRDMINWAIGVTVVALVGVVIWGVVLFRRSPDERVIAEEYLGGDAVCGSTNKGAMTCTRGGLLFTCTGHDKRVGCAAALECAP